ncbi:replication protein, partial [Klebsiella pneumoniae]
EVFEVFYKALKGKRLIVFSGLFKDAMAKFKKGELDDYKDQDKTKYVYAIMYNWGGKKYLEMEKRYLSDDELKEINGKLINEKEVD